MPAMEKIKEKLNIGSGRRKSQPENEVGDTTGSGTIADNRDSIDSELAAMPPHERIAYLKEFDESDKNDQPKKGGLLEKLIARGNRKTEEQIEREWKERQEMEARKAAQHEATHAQVGPGAGASTQGVAGPGGL